MGERRTEAEIRADVEVLAVDIMTSEPGPEARGDLAAKRWAARHRLPHDVGRLLDEISRQRDRADAVRKLHHQIPAGHWNAGFCNGCDFTWPCPTVAAIEGTDR